MIVCLRVDERLIHGQVAMTWTKELKLHGLVVASDEAASNELQKMSLKMAVPEGIKCIIKSVEGVSSILDDPRSEKMRLMVLVPTVRDAVTLCKKYKNIELVNLGNAGKMTSGEKITLTGLYGDGEGKKIVVQSQVGTLADAPKIGYELAKSVLKEYEQ